MDWSRAPTSRRLIDLTKPKNPDIVKWLASLPTSQSKLTENEIAMSTDGGWTVEDLYLMRAINQPNRESTLRKGYNHKRALEQSKIDFFENHYGFDLDPSGYGMPKKQGKVSPREFKERYGKGRDDLPSRR